MNHGNRKLTFMLIYIKIRELTIQTANNPIHPYKSEGLQIT